MNDSKKILLIAVVLLLGSTVTMARGKLQNGDEAELWIHNYSTLPSDPQPGFKKVTLQVSFQHTGTATYKNISFRMHDLPQFTEIRRDFHISKMNPDDIYTTSYTFNVKNDTTPGVYTVPVEVNYTDTDGDGDKKVSMTKEAIVRVSDKTRIEISGVDQKHSITPGEEFLTELSVKNTGQSPANLVKISLYSEKSGLYWKNSKKTIEYLSPGEEKTMEFEGISSESVKSGIYPAMASVREGGNVHNTSFMITVESQVEITDIDQKSPVRPGDDFNTGIVVKNTGESKVTSLDVMVGTHGKGIHWKNSKQSVEEIQTGEEKEVIFKGTTSDSIENGIYTAGVILKSGMDQINNSFTVTVQGEPELTSGGMNTGEEPMTGKKTSVSLQLENIGEGDARAVSISLEEGDFKGSRTSHIGTIEQDETGTAIFDLRFQSPGERELTYHVKYLDENDVEHTKTFTGTVYVEKTPRDYTTIIIALVVSAVVIYFFYRRRKKKEEAREIDV